MPIASLDRFSPRAPRADQARHADRADRYFRGNSTARRAGYGRSAEQTLEFDLRHETEFLARYDRILKAVNERFDLRGSDLSTLVVCCLDNGGKLSKHRRKQFAGRVPDSVFDYIDQVASDISPVGSEPEPDVNSAS
jgi:hypothetical protein